jgi:hypothetical protein
LRQHGAWYRAGTAKDQPALRARIKEIAAAARPRFGYERIQEPIVKTNVEYRRAALKRISQHI